MTIVNTPVSASSSSLATVKSLQQKRRRQRLSESCLSLQSSSTNAVSHVESCDLFKLNQKDITNITVDGPLRIINHIGSSQSCTCPNSITSTEVDIPFEGKSIPIVSEHSVTLAFGTDDTTLAVGLTSGKVKIYNPMTSVCNYVLSDNSLLTTSMSPVTAVKFKPEKEGGNDGIITITYAPGDVKTWHYQTGQCLNSLKESRQLLSGEYSPIDGSHFVTAGDDGILKVYDTQTWKETGSLQPRISPCVMDGHRSRVFSICFHPTNPNELISGGWDSSVQFWDLRESQSIRRIHGPHISGEGLDIDPTGKEILTTSYRKHKALEIWDYRTGQLIEEYKPDFFPSMFYCGKWLTSNYIFCGGAASNILKVIERSNMSSLSAISNLPGAVYSIAVSKLVSKLSNSTLPRIAFAVGRCLYYAEITNK